MGGGTLHPPPALNLGCLPRLRSWPLPGAGSGHLFGGSGLDLIVVAPLPLRGCSAMEEGGGRRFAGCRCLGTPPPARGPGAPPPVRQPLGLCPASGRPPAPSWAWGCAVARARSGCASSCLTASGCAASWPRLASSRPLPPGRGAAAPAAGAAVGLFSPPMRAPAPPFGVCRLLWGRHRPVPPLCRRHANGRNGTGLASPLRACVFVCYTFFPAIICPIVPLLPGRMDRRVCYFSFGGCFAAAGGCFATGPYIRWCNQRDRTGPQNPGAP
jgi:hypothetical protein